MYNKKEEEEEAEAKLRCSILEWWT